MPYPNSQSPITMRMNAEFADPQLLVDRGLIDDLNALTPLSQLARSYGGIARNDWEANHIATWPAAQQDTVRAALVRALMARRPVVFDWEQSTRTTTSVVDFGATQPLSITFRSPQVYPPYTAPP